MSVDPVVVSWVLHSLKIVIGLEDIRNIILKHFLEPFSVNIQFGKTLGLETSKTKLLKYLETTLQKSSPQYVLFTAINRPDGGETHYQSFVLDRRLKKLWMIDPARSPCGGGIYKPYISTETIAPFFQTHGYDCQFIKTSSPCQTCTDDVFCQSWSLYLQIRFTQSLLSEKKQQILSIPSSQDQRSSILLKFYQSVLQIKKVASELVAVYQHIIRTHRSLVRDVKSKTERQQIRQYYLQVDPLKIMRTIQANHLFD